MIVYGTLSIGTLQVIDFDILALGEDHTGDRFTIVENWCYEQNKSVIRLKRTPGISSSEIKQQLPPRHNP